MFGAALAGLFAPELSAPRADADPADVEPTDALAGEPLVVLLHAASAAIDASTTPAVVVRAFMVTLPR